MNRRFSRQKEGNMATGNSVMDEIREQHKKMKGKSLKEKFKYFWEYYRVATLVTILVVIFVGNLIYTVVTAKDNAFYAVLVNGYTDMDTEEYMAGFDEYAQIDTKNYSTTLETNFTLSQDSADTYAVANLQKFAAQVAAQEVDVMIADPDTFQQYTENGYLGGLNEFLSEETLARYEDRLIYANIPDDDTEEEVPVGIQISDCALLQETQAYAGREEVYFGIVVNTRHTDNAEKFLEYIFQQS